MTLDGMGWRLEGSAEEFSQTKEELEIIKHLKQAGMRTPKEVADALSLKPSTSKMRLSRMKARGVITGYGGKYWINREEDEIE